MYLLRLKTESQKGGFLNMKKFCFAFIFLLAIIASLFVVPVSMAATHHTDVKPQLRKTSYTPGTSYYSFSSLITSGPRVGTLGAGQMGGGLTLYIAADGTFTGLIAKSAQVVGSFQSDGSLQFVITLNALTHLHATLYPQIGEEYTGTFLYTANSLPESGLVALVPVENPLKSIDIHITALTTAGPDQTTPYAGVVILDPSGLYGTLRLQDGRVLPIVAHMTSNAITFTFLLTRNQIVLATGTLGTVPVYTGTFVGPQRSDSGDWTGSSFLFNA